MNYFITTLIIMLFYSLAINGLTYSMPEQSLNYVTSFSDLSNDIEIEGISQEVTESVEAQTNIPVVELGALVFYSGNILIDLLLNFAFAIPQMIIILLSSITFLLGVDSVYLNMLQLFLTVTITIVYFLAIIQLITGIRSGRLV